MTEREEADRIMGILFSDAPEGFPWEPKKLAAIEAALTAAREAGRVEGLEEGAKSLDECAQDFNRIRDPGMANHCRAKAKAIRALKTEPRP